MEIDQQIKLMTRDIKNLQQEQYRREKRLDKIINRGEPEQLKDIQQQTKMLNALNQRFFQAQQNFEKAQFTSEQQLERSKDVEIAYDEALMLGRQYGITEEMLDQIKNLKVFPTLEELKKESGAEEEKELKRELIRKKQIEEQSFLSSKKKLVQEIQKEKNKCQSLKDQRQRLRELKLSKTQEIEQKEIEIEKLSQNLQLKPDSEVPADLSRHIDATSNGSINNQEEEKNSPVKVESKKEPEVKPPAEVNSQIAPKPSMETKPPAEAKP